MAKLVSKTYGDAYLSLAEEKGNLDLVRICSVCTLCIQK